MSDFPVRLRLLKPGDEARPAGAPATQVGYVNGVLGGPERMTSLAALFPDVGFDSVGDDWPDQSPHDLTALIVGVDCARPAELEGACRRIARRSKEPPVVVVLLNADVTGTRRLMRAGAADVLPAPVSESALTLSLERLLARGDEPLHRPPSRAGQVVALLKAGGGVGATSLGTQLAILMAARRPGAGVCFADLDLQFGEGALYLDLAESMTITDVLSSSGALDDIPLASALAAHRSGVRVLAAPRELAPLDVLTPALIETLIKALRRDFALTLIDGPSAWTAWTNRALQLCDRIVMVTNLSVPHIDLVKRQLRVLQSQRLDQIPLTLVCNRVSADQQALVSIKAAQRALGRDFDVIIPEDRRLMNEAINQGIELSAVRRGSKIEKALEALAEIIAPAAADLGVRTRR